MAFYFSYQEKFCLKPLQFPKAHFSQPDLQTSIFCNQPEVFRRVLKVCRRRVRSSNFPKLRIAETRTRESLSVRAAFKSRANASLSSAAPRTLAALARTIASASFCKSLRACSLAFLARSLVSVFRALARMFGVYALVNLTKRFFRLSRTSA